MAKLWRETVGERGLRVVLFERTPGGSLYREVWRGRTRLASKKCLGHRDREKAKVDAYTLLVSLKSRDDVQRGAPLTLQLLFDNYEASPAFDAKAPRTRVDDRRKLERVVTFLGADRKAGSLSDSDVEAYALARRQGHVTGRKCRNRAIEADLSCLRAMLNWGVRQRHRDGTPLLPYNPLRGVRLPKEKNPRRPVATWERFKATRTAMQAQQRSAKSETARLRWLKLELALLIMEATGRRLGSIRQLRWEDISLGKRPMIHWREDLGRTLDYLETRSDFDRERIGYFGQSWGASTAFPPAALEEDRFKAMVFLAGGLTYRNLAPEAAVHNFLPRVTTPLLMLNGE